LAVAPTNSKVRKEAPMTRPSFRFLHAGDFHLESPLHGVATVPEVLYDDFLDAPYRAAERVFETAMAEEVDLVVLSGDLVDVRAAGPRGPLFLVEQFTRLAERGIRVYWAGGVVDRPKVWPRGIELPDNVHLFARGRPQEVIHQRDGVPITHLSGTSGGTRRPIRVGDFQADPAGLFSIAVAYSATRTSALRSAGIDYWALGGLHQRTTIAEQPALIHYPGSPQGREPSESGPHGCTLVEVDGETGARTTFIPTDVLRWIEHSIEVDESFSREQLEQSLAARVQSLKDDTPGLALLIHWRLSGTGPLLSQLRREAFQEELLAELRKRFGEQPPIAWSAAIDGIPSAPLAADEDEEDTILGDFLRELRDLEANAPASTDLTEYLRADVAKGAVGQMLMIDEPDVRRRVLRQVGSLGIDLLSGEEQ